MVVDTARHAPASLALTSDATASKLAATATAGAMAAISGSGATPGIRQQTRFVLAGRPQCGRETLLELLLCCCCCCWACAAAAESWRWDDAQSMWVVAPPDEPGQQPATLCAPAADPLAALSRDRAAVLHEHGPTIVQYDDFFTAEEAAGIIHAASGSVVADAAQFGRAGGVVWLPHRNTSAAAADVVALVERISKLVGIELERAESLQVAWCECRSCAACPVFPCSFRSQPLRLPHRAATACR